MAVILRARDCGVDLYIRERHLDGVWTYQEREGKHLRRMAGLYGRGMDRLPS
jgi:hypothetical protein